jgi:hypothetical protein
MANHWSRLAPGFGDTDAGDLLATGADEARSMLTELARQTAPHDLYGHSAAQGTGAALALARSRLLNRGLERNQALRFGLLDLQHLLTLLGYLGNVTAQRGDPDLERFCTGWQKRLGPLDAGLREAISELGNHPDDAIKPLDSSLVGRVTHGAGWVVGTLGEATDRVTARVGLPKLARPKRGSKAAR